MSASSLIPRIDEKEVACGKLTDDPEAEIWLSVAEADWDAPLMLAELAELDELDLVYQL